MRAVAGVIGVTADSEVRRRAVLEDCCNVGELIGRLRLKRRRVRVEEQPIKVKPSRFVGCVGWVLNKSQQLGFYATLWNAQHGSAAKLGIDKRAKVGSSRGGDGRRRDGSGNRRSNNCYWLRTWAEPPVAQNRSQHQQTQQPWP